MSRLLHCLWLLLPSRGVMTLAAELLSVAITAVFIHLVITVDLYAAIAAAVSNVIDRAKAPVTSDARSPRC